MRYAWIRENTGVYGIDEMCEALEVSRSSYYCWLHKAPSARELEDAQIKSEIVQIHDRAKGRYGYRPIHAHLVEAGVDCGRDRARRLMRQIDIAGDQSSSYKPQGTDSDHDYGFSPNLLKVSDSETGKLKRKRPSSIDEVWVADTTYIKTKEGWMYLAVVMDLFSRRIVGWSLSRRNDAELACAALKAAALTRGCIRSGIIHHSDRGSTYACNKYRKLLCDYGMLSSMSAKGNCYDNAAMESFFGRFKVSTVRDEIYPDEATLRSVAFEYIEPFYNMYRKHSSLEQKSPIQFEEKFSPPMGGTQRDVSFTNN